MTPQEPEKLKVYLDRLARVPGIAGNGLLAFYLDDEPEMRAVPTGRSEDLQRLVKGRFPGAATAMATVRPSYCREYLRGADFFMLDQYPFPNMPMSWLGDAMDRAARERAGTGSFGHQAFSDGTIAEHARVRQMDCLAFLSSSTEPGDLLLHLVEHRQDPRGAPEPGTGRRPPQQDLSLAPGEEPRPAGGGADALGIPGGPEGEARGPDLPEEERGGDDADRRKHGRGPCGGPLKMGEFRTRGKGTSRGSKAAEAAMSGPAREALQRRPLTVEQGAIRLTLSPTNQGLYFESP